MLSLSFFGKYKYLISTNLGNERVAMIQRANSLLKRTWIYIILS